MESGCTPHMGPIYIVSWGVAKLVIIIAIHLRMATIGHLWISVCCQLRVRLDFSAISGLGNKNVCFNSSKLAVTFSLPWI